MVADNRCSDIRYLKQLKERQEKIGKERELLNCFKLENEYIPVCADMELEGIKVNVNKWLNDLLSQDNDNYLMANTKETEKIVLRMDLWVVRCLKWLTKKNYLKNGKTKNLMLY